MPQQLDLLVNDVLTYIEQREAEQIAYGIYDVTMTGRELLDGYQPIDNEIDVTTDRDASLTAVLQRLADDALIIRFDRADDPKDWVFRSRVAEIVRLLAKLRQRIVRFDNERPRHRISSGKRLVEDVTFHVAPVQSTMAISHHLPTVWVRWVRRVRRHRSNCSHARRSRDC